MLGPVFAWELVRAGRRRWHWWARTLYVGLLLFLLYVAFESSASLTPGAIANHRVLARIGAEFYALFSFCQLIAVLLISPIYAATSISEEKTRQTLPFLLTSRLQDSEIVFGKLALAMLRVAEMLLCGLPLCALSLLLGGVTPEAMLLDFLLAADVAWASCALAVLLAICTRRLVEALMLVLLLQAAWYSLPAVEAVARVSGAGWLIPTMFLETNALRAMYHGQTTGIAAAWHGYLLSLAATAAFAAICSLLALRALRPAWRREGERGGATRLLFAWIRQRRAALTVWDKPFLWRELKSRGWSTIDRIAAVLYVATASGLLIAIGIYWQASANTIASGQAGTPPASLLIAVIGMLLYLSFLALPYLAVSGATAFAEERDGDHFDLLCITLLDQRHLIQAKAARLLRLGLVMLLLPFVLQVLVLALGWSRWSALVLNVLQCTAAAAFWSMLGMAIGLRMAKTVQAIVLTVVIGIAIGIVIPWISMMIDENNLLPIALCCTPAQCMLLQVQDNRVEEIGPPGTMTLVQLRWLSLFYTLLYAAAAAAMYRSALRPYGPWREALARPADVERRLLTERLMTEK
jgi:ABC-type transport system involved in multi-copper enzyme maturation permease subunit